MTSSSSWCSESADGVVLSIVVVPRASKTRVVGVHDDRLKIQLNAPPVDGAANKALIAMLAKAVGVKKSAVEIVAGATARKKRVQIHGVDLSNVRNVLA